ncbi:hypothetical protein [Dactylosporangium salmoneum]|uniref:DUF1624 domain-containing protein n=1 Tax=Dactylosporangium salmoneum TaxID=53361 RepID=A0ABN3HB93_9ACTN
MIRRIAPALGLFFLAPLVAEFLLGNLPITMLPAIVALAPMYGGGALLIRELARRRGLGWPNILILAAAYGVIEEGLTTQSLFNPNYADAHLLADGYVPQLGIGVPWTIFVIGLHVFWSVGTPIVMVESLAGERRTTPWLGRTGLVVTAVLFAIGIAVTSAINMTLWPYTSTAAQFAVTGVVVAALIAVGLFVRIGLPKPRTGAQAPSAWIVLIATLIAGGVFEGVATLDALPTWAGVALLLVPVAGFFALAARWSAAGTWGDAHRLAIGAGGLLTYAWHSFIESPTGAANAVVDLVGNAIFTLGALALIWVAARRLRRRSAPTVFPA